MATFRKIELKIKKTNHGRYLLTAKYKGREVKTTISDSECYDWLEDSSDKKKHQEAKRYAYKAIVSAAEVWK